MPRARTTPTSRLPPQERAGTHLSNFIQPVLGSSLNGAKHKTHGYLDYQQRVFQSGGEASNFIRWTMKAITLDLSVYHQCLGLVDTIEMIDNVRNECWRCRLVDAREYGYAYLDANLGNRWAIPLERWERLDANGKKIVEERPS